VTPVAVDKVQEKPQTMAKHTPQLYSRRSFRGDRLSTATDSDVEDDTSSPVPDDLEALLSPSSQLPQHPPTNPPSSHNSLANTVPGGSTRSRRQPLSEDYVFVPSCPTIPEKDENSAADDILSSLSVSLALPDHTRGRGIQCAYRQPDDKRVLVFHGIILRSQLVTLLENGIFFKEAQGSQAQPDIDHTLMSEKYPRYSSVFDVNVSEHEKTMLMDLSVFMNPSPYTISHQAPLPQVFNLFRTMGLRHLPVIQDSGIVSLWLCVHILWYYI
jgi:CBS domain-containing protein